MPFRATRSFFQEIRSLTCAEQLRCLTATPDTGEATTTTGLHQDGNGDEERNNCNEDNEEEVHRPGSCE